MKIISFIAILLLSFNAIAIDVNYSSSSSLVSKEELFQIVDENLNNPRISRLGADFRLFAMISTKVSADGSSIYYETISLQKKITDKNTGKKYWIDLSYRTNYGAANTKQYIVDQMVDIVLNHVNTWTLSD